MSTENTPAWFEDLMKPAHDVVFGFQTALLQYRVGYGVGEGIARWLLRRGELPDTVVVVPKAVSMQPVYGELKRGGAIVLTPQQFVKEIKDRRAWTERVARKHLVLFSLDSYAGSAYQTEFGISWKKSKTYLTLKRHASSFKSTLGVGHPLGVTKLLPQVSIFKSKTPIINLTGAEVEGGLLGKTCGELTQWIYYNYHHGKPPHPKRRPSVVRSHGEGRA